MQKLPENIDEIEAFYKGELEELETAPSPALWANISQNIPSALPPPSTGSLGLFSKLPLRNVLIGSVSGVAALVGIYSFVSNSEKSGPTAVTPKNEVVTRTSDTLQPISSESPTRGNTQNVPDKNQGKNFSTWEKVANNVSVDSIGLPIKEEIAAENIEAEAIVEKTQDPDLNTIESIPAKSVETNHDVSKPHPSFFENKASQLKDSARPLFVPKKK